MKTDWKFIDDTIALPVIRPNKRDYTFQDQLELYHTKAAQYHTLYLQTVYSTHSQDYHLSQEFLG